MMQNVPTELEEAEPGTMIEPGLIAEEQEAYEYELEEKIIPDIENSPSYN